MTLNFRIINLPLNVLVNIEKLSLRTLEVHEMEEIEAGSCSMALAGLAFGSAVVSIAVPGVALLGWAAVSAWMGKCM